MNKNTKYDETSIDKIQPQNKKNIKERSSNTT